ncbi:MAG: hypothetical protein QOH60_4218 [Mycobacterium sp.]|nr:hypothetical protein [Mycobacterium sp.]
MRFTDDEIEAALFCVTETIDRRRRAGVPVPEWMLRLGRRFDLASLTSAMSGRRHESGSEGEQFAEERLMSTKEVALVLCLTPRHVQRIANDLDGEKIGGRLLFRLSAVLEYGQEKSRGDQHHRRRVRAASAELEQRRVDCTRGPRPAA